VVYFGCHKRACNIEISVVSDAMSSITCLVSVHMKYQLNIKAATYLHNVGSWN
jgi:hypothetical protein